ncbi:fumarylacetoacetate hydrolase family protein [Aspergillus puulaauensis]|uniref:Fumarylacetoacetase-like C-terminal domain-containing protein n=1 Tax=Aspergillus puulaauensis TaxID=1220207 RepID=A0A7R8AMD7_9EURO|nr:uncharacterized protein APUU_40126S [Aspergillus puulaauensis]BCS23682.1 hypothetical protein APUU_40126S [Aspergillus puulaauensis]
MPYWTHLIRFVAVEDGETHLGQLVDSSRDIGEDSISEVPIKAFRIEGSVHGGRVTEEVLQVSRLLSPIDPQECSYIRCIGLNYKKHAQEASIAIPDVPALFSKPRTAIADPFPGTIKIPKFAQDGTSDYEAELVVVIGKSARDITAEAAPAYILGYTVANDVSARATQMKSAMPSFSKGLDSSCPLGPVLVSSEALTNPQSLSVKTIYNGKTMQDGSTSDMIFSVYELVSYLSQGTTLEPGTILLTGTPEGIGYFRSPRVFLGDGDEIRISIDGIGTLVNKIEYE